MTTDVDSLGDLYVDVTGEEAVTETQEEEPSHDPIEEGETVTEEVSDLVDDGLDDAVAGAEVTSGTSASS